MPESQPQAIVANFVTSWVLNWSNFTPATVQFGSALLSWYNLLRHGTNSAGSSLVVGLGTGLQMSLLGAPLTFTPNALGLGQSLPHGTLG